MPSFWIVINLAFMASVLVSPGATDNTDLAIEWTCIVGEGGDIAP